MSAQSRRTGGTSSATLNNNRVKREGTITPSWRVKVPGKKTLIFFKFPSLTFDSPLPSLLRKKNYFLGFFFFFFEYGCWFLNGSPRRSEKKQSNKHSRNVHLPNNKPLISAITLSFSGLENFFFCAGPAHVSSLARASCCIWHGALDLWSFNR